MHRNSYIRGKIKENYWPGEPERHQKAALLGWIHRRGGTGITTTRVQVTLTPSQSRYLGYLRAQVEEGEPGKRLPTEGTASWIGYGSSYPDWMRNQEWSRAEVLRVFDFLKDGKGFREKSVKQLRIADAIKDELARIVRQESHDQKRWGGGRPGKKIITGTRGYRAATVSEESLPAWVLGNPVKRLPNFHRLDELSNWIRGRAKPYGNLNKYYSSQEYYDLYPEIRSGHTRLAKIETSCLKRSIIEKVKESGMTNKEYKLAHPAITHGRNPVTYTPDHPEVARAGARYLRAINAGADKVDAFRDEYDKVYKYISHSDFLRYVANITPRIKAGSTPAYIGGTTKMINSNRSKRGSLVITYGARLSSTGSGNYYPVINGTPHYTRTSKTKSGAESEAKKMAQASKKELGRGGYKVSMKKVSGGRNPASLSSTKMPYPVPFTKGEKFIYYNKLLNEKLKCTVTKVIYYKGKGQKVYFATDKYGREASFWANRSLPGLVRAKEIKYPVNPVKKGQIAPIAGNSSNPFHGATKIYDNVLALEAQKGMSSMWPGEEFRHDFKTVKGKAAVYGLPDGSLLIKGNKRLWKKFNYPKGAVS